jgi:phosphoglycolate phosphatase-like HAD superfamily hydrolase
MIKAVIFDFDGVIVESAEIKTEAFRALFADYPDKLPEITAYHRENAGISRYDKFRYFYEKLLGRPLTPEKEKELGDRFSRIVLEKILAAPPVAGAEDFMKNNCRRYRLFIASGTPEEELAYILSRRGLDSYFRGAYGTPRTKPEIVKQILNEHRLDSREVVFVGDAESDRDAAKKTGVVFIARIIPGENSLEDCQWKIRDFTGLEQVLDNISATLEMVEGVGRESGG